MKRLLTILLTLVLVVTLLPMTIYSDGSIKVVNTVKELTDALSDENVDKVVLGNSIHVKDDLKIYKTVTIDLNGKTLSLHKDLDIYGSIVLTIMDGAENGRITGDDIDAYAPSSLVINGGTIEFDNLLNSGELTINDGLVISDIYNRGTLTLNGGKVTTTGYYTIYLNDESVMYANGGTVISGKENSLVNWGYVYCNEGSPGTVFQGSVYNAYEKSSIYGGTYEGSVVNLGLIAAGTYKSTITNTKNNENPNYNYDPVIKGGMFYDDITGEYTLSGLTVTYNVDSTKYALLVVQAKEKAYAPITPSTSGHLVFDGWYKDSVKYSFDTLVEENITLNGVIDHPWGEWTNNGVLTHIRYCTNADCDASQTGDCTSDYVANCETGVSCSKCGVKMNEADPDNHTKLKYYPKLEATKNSDGHVAYWYCEGCDKYYLDEQQTKQVNKEDTILPKLKVDRVPNTGDDSIKWFALMTISATLLVTIGKRKNK